MDDNYNVVISKEVFLAISFSDLSFVLSGGTYNDDPKQSLGGLPSPTPISNNLNNLFGSITPQQASNGKTDYRCLYVFNDNSTETMYNMSVTIASLAPNNLDTPTRIYIGSLFREENQLLKLTPAESISTPSGSFKLQIDSSETELISYTSDNTILATRMQSALNEILEDNVIVTFDGIDTDTVTKIFSVSFYGINKNKAFGTISVTDNTIIPVHTASITKSVIGSPINTVTIDIGEELTPPTGIIFAIPSASGIMIGTLRPNEGFPLWIKRVVPPLADSVEDDGVRILCKIRSSPTL